MFYLTILVSLRDKRVSIQSRISFVMMMVHLKVRETYIEARIILIICLSNCLLNDQREINVICGRDSKKLFMMKYNLKQ